VIMLRLACGAFMGDKSAASLRNNPQFRKWAFMSGETSFCKQGGPSWAGI
jgi:hypothetical protein